MTVYTFASTATDAQLASGHATYNTMAAGSGILQDGSGTDLVTVGQRFFGGAYDGFEGFIEFDTSSIPDSESVIDAVLSITAVNSTGSSYTLQAYLHDFGSTVTVGDWVAFTVVGAKPLLATFPVGSLVVNTRQAWSSQAAFPANINKTGFTRILLITDKEVSSTSPGGNEFTNIADGTYATSALRPRLVVTTNSVPDTPTNLTKSLPNTDTSPVFTADVSDTDSLQAIKARFTLYESDGTTLIGSVDSSLIAGPHNATAEYSSALPVGTYKVKATTIDDLGAESSATSQITFYITTNVTIDNTLLWSVKQNITDDITLVWSINLNGEKDLTLIWEVKVGSEPKDIQLLWNVSPVWEEVSYDSSTPSWELVNP